jgi:RNA polymerase sigma-32 factor
MQHAPVQVADLEAKPIERRIFEGRRLAEDPSTLAELAYEFGISRERARQIEMSSFEKVQNAMKHRVAAMGTPAPLQVR